MYQIRAAQEADISDIMKIYACARAFMAKTGNPNQWGTAHPSRDILLADIYAGNLYAVELENEIHGVFAFIPGEDPTYRYIEDGNWHADMPYAAIHRVASDGSGGIFASILKFCGSRSKYLRIDTHHDNKVMQHVLEKNGFQRCGIIYLENGDPRIAYDRT